MVKLVVAGSAGQYRNWCVGNKLNPDDYKYIGKAEQIYGHRDCWIYRVGQYYLNPGFNEINDYCVAHNIKPVFLGMEDG